MLQKMIMNSIGLFGNCIIIAVLYLRSQLFDYPLF